MTAHRISLLALCQPPEKLYASLGKPVLMPTQPYPETTSKAMLNTEYVIGSRSKFATSMHVMRRMARTSHQRSCASWPRICWRMNCGAEVEGDGEEVLGGEMVVMLVRVRLNMLYREAFLLGLVTESWSSSFDSA